MPYFAKVENNIVTDVKQIELYELNDLKGEWFETSYLAIGGRFYDPETMTQLNTEDIPLRKNFAKIGFNYNRSADAFIPPKPYKAWVLNNKTYLWEPPFKAPEDNKTYAWDNNNDNWVIWRVGEYNV